MTFQRPLVQPMEVHGRLGNGIAFDVAKLSSGVRFEVSNSE